MPKPQPKKSKPVSCSQAYDFLGKKLVAAIMNTLS